MNNNAAQVFKQKLHHFIHCYIFLTASKIFNLIKRKKNNNGLEKCLSKLTTFLSTLSTTQLSVLSLFMLHGCEGDKGRHSLGRDVFH